MGYMLPQHLPYYIKPEKGKKKKPHLPLDLWRLYALLAVGASYRPTSAGLSGGAMRQDKHVFILGHGSIGRALEARLRPFGARVTGFTRGGRDGTTPVSGALLGSPAAGRALGQLQARALCSIRVS